jgi:hypothetical protein
VHKSGHNGKAHIDAMGHSTPPVLVATGAA